MTTLTQLQLHHFDHERIPERVVHARGTGAFGTFRLYESAADVTMAKVLTDTSLETPVFVRFSTVLGNRGSADTVRDVRGFAVKFYTEEGNWDIVGNNIPVFFIQDALKFPDLIHAAKPEPHNEVPQAQSAHNNFWDFMYMHSEATHMFMWAMSDRTIPRSYRMMQGFGVNTYTLTNDKGEVHFVKFHFTPELGVHSLVWDEALKICGQDPDFHRKDLEEAISRGLFPKWKFGIQVLPQSREHDFDFDILDATKVWPEAQVPIRYIGELELNQNVDEYFPQTEQVAFATGHVVPGIGFSDDPLLQGRNFSYFDTQITRLGNNWEELPINKPICPVMSFNRDGAGRHTITKGTINYWPNRFGTQPPLGKGRGGYEEHPHKISGIKDRATSKKFKDHFSQAQLFYNSLSGIERSHLTSALCFELDHCDDAIVYERLVQRLVDIEPDLATAVGNMIGATKTDFKASTAKNAGATAKGLSQLEYAPKELTIASRKVAILVADGYDSVALTAMLGALEAAKAIPVIIGTRRGATYAENREGDEKRASVIPDHHLEGQRSTMFDAILVPGGGDASKTLLKNMRARQWICEAFGHLKTIGAVGDGVIFLTQALGEAASNKIQVSATGEQAVESYGVVTLRDTSIESFSQALDVASQGYGFWERFAHGVGSHRCWQRELDGVNQLVTY